MSASVERLARRHPGRPGAGVVGRAGIAALRVALALAAAAGLAATASAQTVSVEVTLVSVEAIDDYDLGSEADHYAKVRLFPGGEERRTVTIDERDHVGSEAEPAWEVSFDAAPTGDPFTIVIELWDSDPFGDSQIDIGIEGGRALFLFLDPATCRFEVDVTPPPGEPLDEFPCGQTVVSGGTATDSAALRFRVDVERPPTTAGANVRCLHSPIHPDPGEDVTITAEFLDGNFQTNFGTVEIYTQGQSTPDVAVAGVSSTTHQLAVDSPSFTYGCQAVSGTDTAWTGWRRVTVGDPQELAEEPATPVLFTAPRRSAIDIVFNADRTSYTTGIHGSQFHQAVEDAIAAYYNSSAFLVGQDRINFWVSRSLALAESFEQGCDHDVEGISFTDAHAILHTNPSPFRNCAPGGRRVFSATAGMSGLLRHETGHRPFGLADEYCDLRNPPAGSVCDGGYFEAEPFPNLYGDRTRCENDAPNLEDGGVARTAADCGSFTEDVAWWFDDTWWISEPVDDLMVNNSTPRAADRRRIQWLLDRCLAGDC